MSAEGSIPTYALRIMPRAERDILAATARLAETAGDDEAVAWQEGLFNVIATLAVSPRRCARAR